MGNWSEMGGESFHQLSAKSFRRGNGFHLFVFFSSVSVDQETDP